MCEWSEYKIFLCILDLEDTLTVEVAAQKVVA